MTVCSQDRNCVIQAVHAIIGQKQEGFRMKATLKLAFDREENKSGVRACVCLCAFVSSIFLILESNDLKSPSAGP